MSAPRTTPGTPGAGRARLLAACAVAFALVETTCAAWSQGWTYDEPFHLGWSRRMLDSGITERDSQERFNTKTPVMLCNVALQKLALGVGWSDPRVLRLAARLPSVGWLAALLAATFLIARRVVGERAALLATAAVALDPSVCAHSSLATVDTAYAFATLLTLGTALGFVRAPSLGRAAAVGLALGLAFVVKFTAVLLLAGLFLLPLATEKRPRQAREGRLLIASLLLVVVMASAVLCAGYMFVDVAQPLGTLSLKSAPMLRAAQTFPGLALPLPAPFLTGLDRSLAFERTKTWNVYALGRVHPKGVWFYFPLLWLVKTPLLALAAQIAGLVRGARAGILRANPAARYLAANLLLSLCYFSLLFNAQLGYRFVLMCIPMAWILASAGLASAVSRTAARAAAGVALVTLLESALYFDNPLAFTNAAVWPKREVFRLIADSNVDWGQNRDKIAGWLAANRATHTHLEPLHLLPGHNTFDLNSLAGIWNFEQHRWLREHADPRGHFGHTYLWFQIDDATYQRFMNEARRFDSSRLGQRLCSDQELTPMPPGGSKPFRVSEEPARNTSWIACVACKKGTDFGLSSETGNLYIGHYGESEVCETERLLAGQVAIYRLDPGVHAFCVAEIPNRRPRLPYDFEGTWLVRGRAASVGIHEAPVERHGPVLVE